MNSSSFIRACLLTIALLVQHRSIVAMAEQVCARTPAMALQAMNSNAAAGVLAQTDGYRIAKVHLDPLLNRSWAMIASCGHPDRPWIAMLLPEMKLHDALSSFDSRTDHSEPTPFPVVHSGDLVQLRGSGKNLRIEVAGKAEESGTVGSVVRVHMINSGFDIGREQTLTGIVRGPGDVEIRP